MSGGPGKGRDMGGRATGAGPAAGGPRVGGPVGGRPGEGAQARPGQRPGFGPPRGPGGMHMGMPVEKAKDFKGTLKRLIVYLKPRRTRFVVVFFMSILGTIFAIVSPKIMGKAITRLFQGIMMKIQGVPGAAVDFEYILQILVTLAGLYLISSFFIYLQQFIMAGVAQRTAFDMRRDVKAKLTRLPLAYFDSHPHGDILSRVTNDMDNISSTLQQSLTQLITSAVTLVGVIIMMLTISPLLTLVTILTLPLSALATKAIVKRSQKHFAAQQKILGQLNGHIEEMYTGHKIVKAFGREEKSIGVFRKVNDELYQASWRAQFISGVVMPVMMFFV